MTNSYVQFAEMDLRRRRKPREVRVLQRESQAPRALLGIEKEIAESNAQLRRYLRWKALELKQLLDGEIGEEMRELKQMLRTLTPADGQRLLDFMGEHGWFLHLDQTTRLVILGMINTGIMRMRVREGLPSMDDSLPGEPPTVFEICRTMLKVNNP